MLDQLAHLLEGSSVAAAHPVQHCRLFFRGNSAVHTLLKDGDPAPCDVQCWVHAYPARRDVGGQVVIEDSRAVFVAEPAVHDRVVFSLDDHPHGVIRAAVRHDPAVAAMSFHRDRRQLLVGERWPEGIGPKRAPARCHHLEEISALFDELTGGMLDAVYAIGLGTHEPAVAAADRYRAA